MTFMLRYLFLSMLWLIPNSNATADLIISIPDVTVVSGSRSFLDVLVSSDGTDDLQSFFADFSVGGITHAAAPINFEPSAIPAPQLFASAPNYVFLGDSLEADADVGQLGVDFVTDSPGGVMADDRISVLDETLSGTNRTLDVADGQFLLARLNFLAPTTAPDGAVYDVELDDITSVFQDDFGDDLDFSFTAGSITVNSAAVPEPSSIGLLCIIGAGLFYRRQKLTAMTNSKNTLD